MASICKFVYRSVLLSNNIVAECRNKKQDQIFLVLPVISLIRDYFLVPQYSSETVSFLRPFALRDASTRRPFAVAILSRKPCLFFLFLLEG